MKNSIACTALLAGLTTMLAMSPTLNAAPVATAPGQNKLLCFDGTTDGGFGGNCTLKANGAKGPAYLDNTESNSAGDYAGVYIQQTTLTGQTLGSVTQLGYTYRGTVVPTPGDLSLNVPIATNGNGTTDFYLFIDAYHCRGVAGVVDVIHDAACAIWANNTSYANFAALVAAYPTATVATDALPFVIAERTPAEGVAFWIVSDVTLGKPGK